MEDLKEYEKREITELLKNDLYFNENEENEQKLETITAELEEKQNELKWSEAYLQDIENNKHLIDIEYSLFAGITDKDMSDNDKIDSHCAHIVWQAYKAAGKDIDKDGGIIVTPNDIATCKDLEVVQIYGIDPEDYSDRILR